MTGGFGGGPVQNKSIVCMIRVQEHEAYHSVTFFCLFYTCANYCNIVKNYMDVRVLSYVVVVVAVIPLQKTLHSAQKNCSNITADRIHAGA